MCANIVHMGWRTVAMIVLATSALSGCADPQVAATEQETRDENVDFQPWETPVELTADAAQETTVAYGECERVEPTEENVDIEINCGRKWAEVAWFVVSAETIETLAPEGSLNLALSLPDHGDRLRGSVHRVTDDGTVKLTSLTMLFDGDVLDVPIEEIADHYVYLARGRDLINVWGTGEVPFTVTLK